MTKVVAKHLPYENGHLGEVTRDMALQGPPTITVVKFGEKLYALTGSHRLAAAEHLGLIPKIVIEPAEAAALPDEHWRKVAETLPEYEFDHVLALDLSEFE